MENTPLNADSISEATHKAVSDYLAILGSHEVTNLYREVIDEVERPLLDAIMKHTQGNQSNSAICLGINRATLRSKLKRHGLL